MERAQFHWVCSRLLFLLKHSFWPKWSTRVCRVHRGPLKACALDQWGESVLSTQGICQMPWSEVVGWPSWLISCQFFPAMPLVQVKWMEGAKPQLGLDSEARRSRRTCHAMKNVPSKTMPSSQEFYQAVQGLWIIRVLDDWSVGFEWRAPFAARNVGWSWQPLGLPRRDQPFKIEADVIDFMFCTSSTQDRTFSSTDADLIFARVVPKARVHLFFLFGLARIGLGIFGLSRVGMACLWAKRPVPGSEEDLDQWVREGGMLCWPGRRIKIEEREVFSPMLGSVFQRPLFCQYIPGDAGSQIYCKDKGLCRR